MCLDALSLAGGTNKEVISRQAMGRDCQSREVDRRGPRWEIQSSLWRLQVGDEVSQSRVRDFPHATTC